MRRFVVVLVVALMALTLVACGGGDTEEPVEAPDTGDAAPPPPVVEEDPDFSPVEESVFEPFPIDPEIGIPDSIQSRLDAGQPMIILFRDETQETTDDQTVIIEGVMETYRGLIDLVTFDVGRYVKHDDKSAIEVNADINEDDAAKQLARLLDEDHLDIRFTPFTLIVDKQGYVTWRYRGISDDKTLEREVLRVTE